MGIKELFRIIFTTIASVLSVITRSANSVDHLAAAAELQGKKLHKMSEVDYQLYEAESQEALAKRVDSINKARAKRQQTQVSADDIMAQIKAAAEE